MPPPTIDSPEAMFDKLERTFDRRYLYGDYQLDWVFDCAITAWHMVDWVVRSRGAGSSRADLLARCPQLAVCEQIANGAKHMVLDDRRLQPFDVTTDAVQPHADGSRRPYSPSASIAELGPHDIVLTPVVRITDKDGTTWDAMMLLRGVVVFWRGELSATLSSSR